MPIDINKAEIFCPSGLREKVLSLYSKKITIGKKWGTEFIIPGDQHTTKIMQVIPGFKSSLHFHQHKDETFVLVQGQLHIEFYDPDGTKYVHMMVEPLSCLVLPRCTPHLFSVPNTQEDPSIFIESSTLDSPDDNYRITRSGING